jgi:hypothetical protein
MPQLILSDRNEFYKDVGRVVAAWADIESVLFAWFGRLTNTDKDMAAAIYYSARSFQGRLDMLDATVRVAEMEFSAREFLKTALRIARQYSVFRNAVVHGVPEHVVNKTSRYFGQHVIMATITTEVETAPDIITREHLAAARGTFIKFTRSLALVGQWENHEDGMTLSPELHHELILRLPNPPHSKPSGRKA